MILSEFGVRRPTATLMLFLIILIIGVVSYTKLPVDLFPEIESPALTVITLWPGASAEDIEMKVTRNIEKQLSVVNNLKDIVSQTSEGISRITCTFEWGTDLADAASDVRDRVEMSKRRLPDDIDQPIVYKFNSSNAPIMFFAITASESWEKLYDMIDDEVATPLQRVSGVGAVQTHGGLIRQINVKLNRQKLDAYGITLDRLRDVLAKENLTLPAGNLKIGTVEYTIRVPGEYERPDEIKDIPIIHTGNAIVRMKDVAEIEDGFEEVQQIVENTGRRGMMMMVMKRSGANTVAVADGVLAELEILKRNLPRDVDIRVMTNSSDFIITSINNVKETVVWGGVLVIVISFLFLRSLRSSFIIAMTIPFSLIIAFAFIFLMGWTLNLISLMSLSIAIGMVVDNAVVVLENIATHIEKGEKVKEASIFGSQEVGLAIVASTMTTVVVFLPMIFLEGLEGIFFKQLGGIVVVTLLASLFCSLLLTPMLASKLLLSKKEFNRKQNFIFKFFYNVGEEILKFVERFYGGAVRVALKCRPVVIVGACLALGGSVLLIPLIGTELSPDTDDGEMRITFQLPVSTRVEVTAEMCRKIETLIHSLAERQPNGESVIRIMNWRCGASRSGMGGVSESNYGSFNIRLVPKTQRTSSTKSLGVAVSNAVKSWPEITKVSVNTGNRLMQQVTGSNAGKPIVIDVLGHNLALTKETAEKIRRIAADVPGVIDPTLSLDPGNREIAVVIDREKAAIHGVPVSEAVNTLRTLFYGEDATKFREAEEEYEIQLRLDEHHRISVDDLLNANITTADGRRIRLDAIASIEEAEGPVRIDRKDQQRVVYVEMDCYGRSSGEVIADLDRRIRSEIMFTGGTSFRFSGMAEEQEKSFRSLALMILLGVALVYMVMAAQFESFKMPFVIMFSVPFALSGVFVALFFTGSTISMMTLIGVILLVGTAVNNAIVLLDYTQLMRARDYPLHEAIVYACRERLRPVLITTLTTIGGMLPLALFDTVGSETWRPLGITVIGGLAVSTLVTLVLVPVVYSLVAKRDVPDEFTECGGQ